MIHEFIDYKKKTKNSGTINAKTLRDSIETCSAEQSGSEWPSPTFVPPWLNNLGQKLKNNQNLDWSVCLPNFTDLVYGAFTEKLRLDFKNQNQYEQNEGEEKKSTIEEDSSKKSCFFENSPKECEQEKLIQISESCRKSQSGEKQNREASQIPIFWQVRPKIVNAESSSTESIMSPLTQKKKNFKMAETEVSGRTMANIIQIKNEEEKKQKFPKKLHRMKHRTASGQSSLLREIEVDSLLEEKAKKSLENYPKKKVQSSASDIKRFEAKLLLLQTKISLGKLTPEDMKFLQEIKARAGSKENFEKLMRHVRDVNLKEIFESQSSILKSVQAKTDVESTKTQSRKEEKLLMSSFDENDIKRFSDKLKKNLSKEEKRKCLEEVRNYFEKKRRSEMTKCWMLNPNSKENGIEGEENLKQDKANVKNMFLDKSTADWKSKFRINDAEVVGKAVDETLQKFVEMYHFHVSPSLMSSMKNNVLKGIRSKTIEGEQPLTWHNDVPCNVEGSQLNKQNFLENEQMKRLKSELEYYINNVSEDLTNLKVQSIILEEEKRDSGGKNIEFIYNFSKKSLEQKNSKSVEAPLLKDIDVQAGEVSNATNAKTQTQNLVNAKEKYIQTEKNLQKTVEMQTEGTYAIELRKLKECDVSSGLYRMVRSKQAGKFYLYPENEENSSSPQEMSKDQKNYVFDEGNLKEKKLNRTSEGSEPDKKEKETNVSNVLIVDGMKSKKEVDVTNAPEKQECVWLWDGKKINSGADLKAHVESLLKEKLQEMSYGLEESGKDKFNFLLHNFAKAGRTSSQDNLEFTVLHSGFPPANEHVGFRLENKIQNFGEGSAGTQSLEESHLTSEEKLVKDASTQNSDQAVLSQNVKTWKSSVKSQTSSKTYLRKKRKLRKKRDQQHKKSITDLKKAMQLMRECLSNKRMKFEVESSLKESLCDSGTTLESNTSSYTKGTSDEKLTLVFGLKDSPDHKSKRFSGTVNEHVQPLSGKNLGIKNKGDCQRMEDHMQWELIERVLHTVNCKKRKGLWNDLRELIKSKLGKDIDNEDAKEVCIQIEQDMRGAIGEKAKNSVLAKGYYAKNEGDVEVEIDLTLNDLERIIRRRERNRRRRSLYYKRNSRSLRSSSPRQSRSNFASVQEFRNVLKSVSRSRPTPRPGDRRVIRMNKEN